MNRAIAVLQLTRNLPLSSARRYKGYHWLVVMTVCFGAFMAALDASIVNIALPELQSQFDVQMHEVEWVSLSYLLSLGAFIITISRIADMIGRRWLYICGFVVFIIGSILCGMSGTLSFLIISRVLQAIGAALLQANSVSIVTASVPEEARGRAIGIQASAQGIGLSLGPAIGGTLLTYLNWNWLFYVNVPIGILGTVLGILFLPKDKIAKKENFDVIGALILMPVLVAVIFILNMGMNEGWTSPILLGSYGLSLIGMILFYWVERKTENPLIDFSLFQASAFSIGNLTCVFSFVVLYAVLLLTPFYLKSIVGLDSFASGIYLTIVPIGMTVFTPISGFIADRYGIRIPTIAGMICSASGCILLSLMGTAGYYGFLIPGLFLAGSGLGLFTPPNNSGVMGSVPTKRLGIAGGILNMSRTFGMGFGVTLGGLSYQAFLSLYSHPSAQTAMSHSFRYSFWIIAAIALITVGLSVFIKVSKYKYKDYYIGDGI